MWLKESASSGISSTHGVMAADPTARSFANVVRSSVICPRSDGIVGILVKEILSLKSKLDGVLGELAALRIDISSEDKAGKLQNQPGVEVTGMFSLCSMGKDMGKFQSC